MEEGIGSLFFKTLARTVYRRLLLIEYALDRAIHEVPAGMPVVGRGGRGLNFL